MEIIFVRHGESIGNALKGDEAVYTGRWDCDLTDNGKTQAKALLGNSMLDGIEACYVSPLKRAIQTAEIITNLEPVIDIRIQERSLGEFEGKKISDVMNTPKYAKYFTDPKLISFRSSFSAHAPGGESYMDVCKRVRPFLRDIKDSGYDKILIVSHFVVIRCMLKEIKGLTEEETLALKVPNSIPIKVVI
jgi:broad specificity phosphatase PhoE